MPTIFNSKDSVFFVGGRGTKAGDANSGGCTKAFWDASLNLADVMGPNGEVKSDSDSWNLIETACAVYNNGSGKVRIGEDEGYFSNCVAGLVAYVAFAVGEDYIDGLYEVIYVEPNFGDYIDIDLAYVADTTCDCKLGGAFDTLQNLIDNKDATQGCDVFGYVNKKTQKGSRVEITPGGSFTNNSRFVLEAFNILPGDMNYGQTYYQGPLDCLINGVDTTTPKCQEIDAEGGAYSVANLVGPNVILRNFYLHNTDKAAGHDCVLLSGYGILLENCKFDDGWSAFNGNPLGIRFVRCYVGRRMGYAFLINIDFKGFPVTFSDCVFDIETRDSLYCGDQPNSSIFSRCLFWKGDYGARLNTIVVFENCVFYGQTISCIRVHYPARALPQGHNNIFMPAAAADYIVYGSGAFGAANADFLKKSCAWTIAGAAITNHININGVNRQFDADEVIEADPQFVDAPNGDFRLKSIQAGYGVDSPCLNIGMPTLGKS